MAPNAHIKETLLADLQAKLEKIIGPPVLPSRFWYAGRLKKVERYIHTFEGVRPIVNSSRDSPMIVFRSAEENLEAASDKDWNRSIEIVFSWVFIAGDAGETAQIRAQQDMETALFLDPTDLNQTYSVGAVAPGARFIFADPETGMPLDGFDMTLSLQYLSNFDPGVQP